MINELIGLFCITAVLFFILSALVQFKYIWIVVPLNIIFLGVLFFSYIQFIGTPLPLQYNIPFLKMQTFNEKTIVTIESLFETDDLVHMVVADDKTHAYRYVTYKRTPEFEAQLMKAIVKYKKIHSKIKMILTDTKYGENTGSPFLEPDATQDNNGEQKPPQTGGVETHEATGDGGQTN